MNRKLFKAILLISLFLGNIDSQAASCPGNQIINPANPNECYCANKANAVCGSNKTYNDFFCGCECNNFAEVNPSCTGNLSFDDNTCECRCTFKPDTGCTSPLVYLDKPDCICGCPSPPPACTCVGATIDPITCQCTTPTSKCKGVTWNCSTGKFDYPPKEEKMHSWECKEFNEAKCKWEAPVKCPANQHYIPVYDSATDKKCACSHVVEDCARYTLNPSYDSADKHSKKYICQSCEFPKQYHKNANKCIACDTFTIKALDPNYNYKGTGFLTFSGVLNKEPSDASVAVTEWPLSNEIMRRRLNQFVIKPEEKDGVFQGHYIRGRLSLPQRLYFRWNSDPKFFLSNFEKQPGDHHINDQLVWTIETDPVANSLTAYRAKISSKGKVWALANDLTIGPYASIPADRFEFEVQPIC